MPCAAVADVMLHRIWLASAEQVHAMTESGIYSQEPYERCEAVQMVPTGVPTAQFTSVCRIRAVCSAAGGLPVSLPTDMCSHQHLVTCGEER